MVDSVLNPIGVFDSGFGGLSVLRAMRGLLPTQSMIYLADQAHVPYGTRSLEEVRQFSTGITRFLITQGAKLIVVACNTASVASLKSLRDEFPDMLFVGMEPAVKPAAEQTHSHVVGVLATFATFQGAMYVSVVERFAQGVTILQDDCPGLVAEIEKGNLTGKETERILRKALEPMLNKGVDTIVLGCTHYPFVIPLIQKIAGPEVRVIDPAPAIAHQVQRLLESHHFLLPEQSEKRIRFLTSGYTTQFSTSLPYFSFGSTIVEKVEWHQNTLSLKES